MVGERRLDPPPSPPAPWYRRILGAPEAPGESSFVQRVLSSIPFARTISARISALRYGGNRDLYGVLGYVDVITNLDYRMRYSRGGLAGRIIDVMPDACWRGVPAFEIQEDKDEGKDTDFEKAWKGLDQRLQCTPKFHRVNKLARLGTYAVLLIGEAGGALSEELPRASGDPGDIIFLKPYSGGGGPNWNPTRSQTIADYADASVLEYVTDPKDERYGEPLTYQIKNPSMGQAQGLTVHWSRVIHVAEGLLDDEVFGMPALERVWNLLDDLEKVTGGGAEAFWLRANQGLHLDIDKDLVLKDVADTIAALKDQSEAYRHQQTRWIRTRGVAVKTLGSDVADFSPNADAIITQIAGAKAIPKRVLTGSEMGELASSQDRENFKDQVNGYQTQVAAGWVRALVDRLIRYGHLPTPVGGPDQYFVKWPHMEVMTETERADGAAKWAATNQAAGVTVFTADEIREHWYGMGDADVPDTEQWRADLAVKLATVNKTQGEIVFTSDEIRDTCYGFAPLPESERQPLEAPVKVSSTGAPPDEPSLAPAAKPAPFGPKLKAAQNGLVRLLAGAIEDGDAETAARAMSDLRALAGGPRDYASTQVQLPPELAAAVLQYGRALNPFKLSDEGLEDDPHVTVRYGLESDDPDPVAAAIAGRGPVRLTLGKTNRFEGPDHDVLYVEVESPDLGPLRDAIVGAGADVLPGADRPYVPHVTVAYMKKGLAKMYVGDGALAGLSATVPSLRFSPAIGAPVDLPLAAQDGGPNA